MENESKKLTKKDYLVIFLFYGFVVATLLIIVTELTWDSIFKALKIEQSLEKEIIECFLRAALLEETFKFLGFMLARKKYKINRVADSMFAAGCVGLMYGIVEKLVVFNPFTMIINLLLPMHLLWQWNQGRHYQKYKDNKNEGKKGKAIFHLMLATLVIFLLHGSWDALLSIASYLLNEENAIVNGEMYGGIVLGVTLGLGFIYTIVTFVITIKTARKQKRESNIEE